MKWLRLSAVLLLACGGCHGHLHVHYAAKHYHGEGTVRSDAPTLEITIPEAANAEDP